MGKAPVIAGQKRLPKYVYATPEARGIRGIPAVKRFDRDKAGLPLPEHRHPADVLEIILLARGMQKHVVAGETCFLKGGDVLVILPGDAHSSGGSCMERSLCYWVTVRLPDKPEGFLNLPAEYARRLLGPLREIRRRHFPGTRHLQECLDRVIVDQFTLIGHLRAQANLVLFLTDVLACASQPGGRREAGYAARMCALVQAHPGEKWTVSGLARRMGLEPTRFSYLFKQETGVPPGEYILRARLDKARALLLDKPAMTVTDIAYETGFSSSQHFATTFRRFQGLTPLQFRKAGRSQPQPG